MIFSKNNSGSAEKPSRGGMLSQKKYDILFFWLIAAIPMAVWAINYFVVNGSSFFLAFQEYDENGVLQPSLGSIKLVIDRVVGKGWFQDTLLRSFWLYIINVFWTAVLPIFLSYFMYKKLPWSGFFKVVLFIPSIVSGVVVITAFKYMADAIVPQILRDLFNYDAGLGFLSEVDTRFGTVLFQRLWFSLASGFITTIGVMNTTDAHTIEASIIDGCGMWGEFWHVVLPHAYPTLSLGFIFGFSSMFTDDFGLYTYFGTSAPDDLWTLGYAHTIMAIGTNEYDVPFLSAWGLLESVIILPVTYFYKWIIGVISPSED